MEKTTLVVMAAGIGSRFGTGIKQLSPVDERGHLIIDYSVHDAIKAGFNKIIFVIRRDIEQEFRECIGTRMEEVCAGTGVEMAYAFQNMEDIPAGFSVPEDRKKPWGTGQAVLAASDWISGPFAVINSDDYYGREAFRLMQDFLCGANKDKACMVGFILGNTLSEHGTVTRGICDTKDGYLTKIVETKEIRKTEDGAEAAGISIPADSVVSMNMWGFPETFLDTLKKEFVTFFEKEVPKDPAGAEYLLPILVGDLLKKEAVKVRVLETGDKWFGMTYKEDVQDVKESFMGMISDGIYAENLYGDL